MTPEAVSAWDEQGPIPVAAWRNLLRRHGIRPDKGLGQNFLFEQNALEKVLAAADLDPDEPILEIGAGVGSLTRLLAARVQRVVAVELDRQLLPALREVVGTRRNVRIIEGDILRLQLGDLMGPAPYSVVANIPYQITSLLIRKLMEEPRPPSKVVLTVQREVAQRVVAEPGEMSLLALGVQVYGRPSIVGSIGAGAFYPPPKVSSAILRIDRRGQPLAGPEEMDRLFELARAAFEQRRKQLRNSLSHGLQLEKEVVEELLQRSDVDPKRRPQSLALREWKRLTMQFEGRA